MITHDTVLVHLVRLVDRLPNPPPPARCPRGRPIFYSDRLFLKALVIMTVRRLHKVGELLAVLEEPTPRRCRPCVDCSARSGGASPLGAPSSAGLRLCPKRCPRGSALWGATWWSCFDLGLRRDGRWPWTEHRASGQRWRLAQEG